MTLAVVYIDSGAASKDYYLILIIPTADISLSKSLLKPTSYSGQVQIFILTHQLGDVSCIHTHRCVSLLVRINWLNLNNNSVNNDLLNYRWKLVRPPLNVCAHLTLLKLIIHVQLRGGSKHTTELHTHTHKRTQQTLSQFRSIPINADLNRSTVLPINTIPHQTQPPRPGSQATSNGP